MPEVDPNTPNPNPNTPPPSPPPPTDEKEKEIQRLLNENKSLREKNKEFDTSLLSVREELSALKKAGHKTNGDWQKLAETHETEAKTWKDKYEKANSAFIGTLTGGKLREEALKQGLKPDLVDLLDGMDFDEVEAIIDENNRFNVKGVETAVSNLKKLRPSLFTDARPPSFNPGGPGGTPPAPKSLEEAEAAYLEARKNRFKDPAAWNKAQTDYRKAINEGRKAKK